MAVIDDAVVISSTTTTTGVSSSLKALSLTTDPTIGTAINISGTILAATGVFLVGAPVVIFVIYGISKRIKTKDGSNGWQFIQQNSKVIMSVAVASTMLISVGTAMMPRTETVMLFHIIAGYTCLALSFIHVFQYRKVIRAQAKKYYGFLTAPKKPAPAGAGVPPGAARPVQPSAAASAA
ncbi:MAG: hypothetical protein HQL11_05820 [Candidatus Omnitrophica bacterium]|nr:hypothetical protein [Candidatus Omnitrophota bacterium]